MKDKGTNPEQSEVLQSTAAQKLVIAGAGSGKTSTLCWQIISDINAGCSPKNMVCITFTNAAAREYERRLGGQKIGYMGTLHAWCLLLLNRYGSAIGYKPGAVSMIDEATETGLIKAALFDIKASPAWSVEKVREWKASGKIHNPASIAAKRYMTQIRAASCVDFDSVLFEALRLIKGGHVPELDSLYWDEYQDSGPWDHAIMEATKARKKFVVGDPDQCVYGWRGSSLDWILSLAASPEWVTFYLKRNHRCQPCIVTAANRVISYNSKRLEKDMISTQPPGTDTSWIQIPTFTTPLAEAAWIAAEFKAGNWPKEAAILVRYNSQVPTLVAALEAEGLGVFTGKEGKNQWLPLAISALNALADPANDLAAAGWLAHLNKGGAMNVSTVPAALEALNIANKPHAMALGAMKLPPEAFHAIVSVWVDNDLATTTATLLAKFGEPEQEKRAGIYVGTLHSFKGLEAECVVLAGMSQAAMPGTKTGEDLEEERRLFYVGITRAKRVLVITSPGKFTPPFGTQQDTEKSQFIHEAFPTE